MSPKVHLVVLMCHDGLCSVDIQISFFFLPGLIYFQKLFITFKAKSYVLLCIGDIGYVMCFSVPLSFYNIISLRVF